MMKKLAAFLTCVLLLASPVLAESIYIFEFELNKNNTVNFISLQKSEGTVTKPQESGSYAVLITDVSDEILWYTAFPVSFIITTTPPQLIDAVTMTVKLPADPSARLLKITTADGEEIFSKPIASFCDMNGACDESEDYFSCPVDCKSGSADGVCDSVSDGKCDPDCSASGDPDCAVVSEGISVEKKEGINWKLIFGALVVLGGGGFLFVQYKKKGTVAEEDVKVEQKEEAKKSPKPKKKAAKKAKKAVETKKS